MTLLIAYVALALVVSFLCSILEAVLLSVTPAYLAVMEKEQHPATARLRRLKDDVDRPLAAILSLNTIAHTVGAAGAGAQAARVFGDGAVGIFSGVLTLLILVATEIIPKTLGAVHWKRLAPLVSRVLAWLITAMKPLVWLAQVLTRLLTPNREGQGVSREEIQAIAEAGEREGVVAAGESRVLANLLQLRMVRVRDIMTPADHVISLPGTMRVGEVLEAAPRLHFSRIPIVHEQNGRRAFPHYVLKDDILQCAARDQHERPLSELTRELLAVPDDLSLPEVFDRMVERREHIALAHDANGEMTGVVTMEDAMETLLGLEIFDEMDDESRIQERARAHWEERMQRMGRISDATGGTANLGITGGLPDRKRGPRDV